MNIVGYTYDAAVHCPKCAREYVSKNTPEWHTEDDIQDILDGNASFQDGEGNEIHPVFDTDEAGDTPEHCDDCHAFIDNNWSGDTVKYAVDALREYVYDTMRAEETRGNADTLDEWHSNLKWCGVDDTDQLVMDLYEEVRNREKEAEVD